MNENKNITLGYKLDLSKGKKKIRIFGDNFVENNKNNCKILFNNKEYELMTHFDIHNIKGKLEIE